MSQSKAAKIWGIRLQTLQQWEHGRRTRLRSINRERIDSILSQIGFPPHPSPTASPLRLTAQVGLSLRNLAASGFREIQQILLREPMADGAMDVAILRAPDGSFVKFWFIVEVLDGETWRPADGADDATLLRRVHNFNEPISLQAACHLAQENNIAPELRVTSGISLPEKAALHAAVRETVTLFAMLEQQLTQALLSQAALSDSDEGLRAQTIAEGAGIMAERAIKQLLRAADAVTHAGLVNGSANQ